MIRYQKSELLLLTFFILLASPLCTQSLFQNQLPGDSLIVKANLGLMGRWQTGNLNQISLMPNGSISFDQISYYAQFNSTYHFLKVGDYNSINDLWTYGLYQHRPYSQIFPSFHSVIGFAKSYNIDHSVVTGLGAGYNIHKKSESNFLQLDIYGAYLNFQYEEEKTHETPAIGSHLRALHPLNERISFRWELSTFHSIKDSNFWGGGNLLQLNIMLLKNLAFNVSHQSYYNHQTTTDIKKLNTEMLFGIQYQFNNNSKITIH